jgi:hypothetical protein
MKYWLKRKANRWIPACAGMTTGCVLFANPLVLRFERSSIRLFLRLEGALFQGWLIAPLVDLSFQDCMNFINRSYSSRLLNID